MPGYKTCLRTVGLTLQNHPEARSNQLRIRGMQGLRAVGTSRQGSPFHVRSGRYVSAFSLGAFTAPRAVPERPYPDFRPFGFALFAFPTSELTQSDSPRLNILSVSCLSTLKKLMTSLADCIPSKIHRPSRIRLPFRERRSVDRPVRSPRLRPPPHATRGPLTVPEIQGDFVLSALLFCVETRVLLFLFVCENGTERGNDRPSPARRAYYLLSANAAVHPRPHAHRDASTPAHRRWPHNATRDGLQ